MSEFQQFTWGLLGGAILIVYKAAFYVQGLPDDYKPKYGFTFWVTCFLGFAFVAISGLVSLACDPHNPFIAIFEGAATPALFVAVAKENPFFTGRPCAKETPNQLLSHAQQMDS